MHIYIYVYDSVLSSCIPGALVSNIKSMFSGTHDMRLCFRPSLEQQQRVLALGFIAPPPPPKRLSPERSV